jgi:hypothetical protein
MGKVKVDGKAPGLKNAVFTLTDAKGATVAGVNINDGTFKADAMLENPGYGSLSIAKNGSSDKNDFEIYLEPGDYTLEADANHLGTYPKITSASKIQKELSEYYEIYNKVNADTHQELEQAHAALNSRRAQALAKDAYIALINRVNIAEQKEDKAKFTAFETFVKQYPQSVTAGHLMAKVNVESDPMAYNKIYQNLSSEARNSEEGKVIGLKLSKLVKLLPGAIAPGIAGTTPDGKKFDPSKLDKKGYIIDFWRAGNQVSRKNHMDMINVLQKDKYGKQFGIISISLDSKRDWWTTAITGDQMTWPQYSDLKGDESVNAENWMITTIPSYYVLDGKWRIVERNIPYNNLLFTVTDYAKKH